MSNAAEPKVFGAVGRPFRWFHQPTATDKDAIRIMDKWAEANIASFACEPLARWTSQRTRVVNMNHSVKQDFLALWAAWEKAGVLEILKASYTAGPPGQTKFVHDGWGGGWVARYKRGVKAYDGTLSRLSNHATGHAFDIATRRYPLGANVPGPDPIHQLVPIAKAHGWRWGGEFSRPDPMHFQHETSLLP